MRELLQAITKLAEIIAGFVKNVGDAIKKQAESLGMTSSLVNTGIRPSVALYLGPLEGNRGKLIEQIVQITIDINASQVSFAGNTQSLLGVKIYGMFVNYMQSSGQVFTDLGVTPDKIFVMLVSKATNVTEYFPLTMFIDDSTNGFYISKGIDFFGSGGLGKQILIGRDLDFTKSKLTFPADKPTGKLILDLHFFVEEAEYVGMSGYKAFVGDN